MGVIADFVVDEGDVILDPEVDFDALEPLPDDEILRPEEYNEIVRSRG